MAKVVVLGSLPESLINFRGPLLQAMIAAGHEVHAVAPTADEAVVAALTQMGVHFHTVPLARTGLNPWRDLATVLALRNIFRSMRPDCILAYTIKPVIYGCLAGRMVGSPCYAMITGLGYTFTAPRMKGWLVGKLARGLYKLALSHAERVFFQNLDNLRVFTEAGLLRDQSQAVLINGSGVDLDHYASTTLPVTPIFLMIARLLKDKGIVEYVDAARLVKQQYPNAKFRLVGWLDSNPAAVDKETLNAWISEGVIEYLGPLPDVRPAIATASIYVLPSYHEGMPRTVLEAMSMGRPVITTDVPGCRETVIHGGNGLLVPVRDTLALANAMRFFIEHPEKTAEMGAASRQLAATKFDVRLVNHTILEAMELL
ncbi:MAG: glycosyltransferase family 1 protein [Rugosibacter sp.]|nr:MAG: glycosyltransferase family 1 protein [Rugosibacter sp.]TBR10385.1 MAG: glycosyltransferase family 1 protein [Rugosibacter sp.]